MSGKIVDFYWDCFELIGVLWAFCFAGICAYLFSIYYFLVI